MTDAAAKPHLVRALWGATHPGPTLVVTVLSLALGIAAGVEPARLALLVVAVFAGQVSVGLSNDAIDGARDAAVGRTDKPIAGGAVTPERALAVAVASAILAVGLSVPLGPGLVAAHAIALGSAWAYNAGLKSTPFSIAPFVLSFGLFPSFATLSTVPPALAAPWASVAGAALGAAVHLTNVVRDLDDDRRTGVRGLPHRLGARASVVLAACGILAGAIAVLRGTDATALGLVFFVAVAAVAVAAVVMVFVRSPGRAVFQLTMLAALLLAAQLVVA
ncbi:MULTISPECIES: UbiA family prenyltransferase [Microbacterium]|uniref:UbiA family prenyltransferase n=1 Tax=Microbacterium TaxID=33882 RepID=UPI0023D9E734|nr:MULTISPECIES: UbiA family prenyltransferase [Microbacterium]MDF2047219.1 UbiA family prenyltransferase [Microbacterium sp. Kw_RZR3]MDQ1076071.1 4-hydroxybenzoate polyprenyltransferase [Microbacterium sp. SORGH_AS_0969]MDQ1116310.1 4-hydroxybenzoate polyprenyltransferase [Microbacterium testaceum]